VRSGPEKRAKDYLPWRKSPRTSCWTAVGKPAPTAASRASGRMMAQSENSTIVEVPGYSIVKEIATSNFSSVFLARSERCAETSCSK